MTIKELIDFGECDGRYDLLYFKVDGNGNDYVGLFDCCRIPKESVPEGCFKYSIREDDEGEGPATIEKFVGVNHFGDVILTRELDFKGDNYLEFDELEWGCAEEILKWINGLE